MPEAIARFKKLGILREQDLLLHLPLRYEDQTRLTRIADLRVGELAQVEGVVSRSEITGRGRRILLVDLRDDSGMLSLRFFHFYGSQVAQLAQGRRLRVIGEPRGGLFGMEMVHPRYRSVREGAPLPDRLTPVYPTAAGISQSALRSAVRAAFKNLDLPDTVPVQCEAIRALPSLREALLLLHEPAPDASASSLQERDHPAWQRVIFEELLAQQLSLRQARAARASRRAKALRERALVERLFEQFP
ncbi:MAG: OB-fold nucleic acid binding domain-containing protein, partial [Quisquiliibacterium sp.]